MKVGAIVDGHFLYRSGMHGRKYVNKDAVYPHIGLISQFCAEIAAQFVGDRIEVVFAPAIGGVIMSQWTAYHLSRLTGREVLAVYAEKDKDDNFAFKRGYDALIRGKRGLGVEDVITTGKSIAKVVVGARMNGCDVVGLGVLCNRGSLTLHDVGDVPRLFALSNLKLETWEPAKCPQCAAGIPLNKDLGKGKEVQVGAKP